LIPGAEGRAAFDSAHGLMVTPFSRRVAEHQ
jgi:hypothetical protein